MYQISRILLKYFTSGINEEEARQLEEWRNKAGWNEALFQKIGSPEYLQHATSPIHRKIQREQWRLLERRTLAMRRRKLLGRIGWVAAAVIPMVWVVGLLWMRQESEVKREGLLREVPVRSGAVIRFTQGEQVVIYRDTLFQSKISVGLVENRLDTIAFVPENTVADLTNQTYQIEVPRGAEYVARLEDGTTIHIDAESQLTVPQKFGTGVREVELRGHAYFVVTKDPSRPFIVKTKGFRIRVLGTEFDLNAYEGQEISATLTKGEVQVSNSQSECRLKPRQQASVDWEGKIVVSDVDVYPFVAWKEGRIVFIRQPLEVIMKMLERWYDVQCIFLSHSLKQECFTLDIEKYGEIETVLKSMEKTEKMYFEVNGKQITIHQR